MNLNKVANRAASDAATAIDASLSEVEVERVAAIIARAMEQVVQEVSDQHSTVYDRCLSHDQDLAHKITKEIERKKVALIANLSSLR